MNCKPFRALTVSALALAALTAPALGAGGPAPDRYPYGGPAFTRLIADSDRAAGAGTPQDFYRWLDRAPLAQKSHGLLALTAAEKQKLSRLPTPAARAAEERAFCARLHKMVKTWMPNFSLDEGFEFTNAVKKGERQCLLQSVLLAGLLQRAGVDSGIVMVWRNLRGQATNNSHVVTLVRLADGRNVELDASDPVPFVRHQGLLAEQDGLRDVEPIFAGDAPTILGYRATGDGRRLATRQIRPLPYAFVRSQFDYYRGERTPGGLPPAPGPISPVGLNREARFLRSAIRTSPDNALAVYMLGRVYLKQGKTSVARREVSEALELYADAGWTPDGPRDLAAQILPPDRSARNEKP
ncbi:MAG: hypothetical protein JO250_11500 [Armatimonadetes bacterium]|nr:hypothetical protein [Armatimonadota bacterium]